MKYLYIIISILTLFIPEQSTAQTIRSYGVKLGMISANQSWVYSGSLSNWKVFDKKRNGFIGGGYIEWFDFPLVGLITEAQYVQKGCSDEFVITSEVSPDPIGTKIISPRLDYLSIPILIKLHYEVSICSIYCLGGPRYDILIGKSSDASGAVFDDVKSTDYGITYGGGIELTDIIAHKIGVELRYSPSSQKIYSTNLLTVQNNSIELLLYIGL